MSRSKYAQIHRQLLFHWTQPQDLDVPNSHKARIAYLEHLKTILDDGLEFRKPNEQHAEWIVQVRIEALHRMLCFSEWTLGDSQAHAGRYGQMGFGFTRKFIMKEGGRPVIYVPNKNDDRFRNALVKILLKAKEDSKLSEYADILASWLKTYNIPKHPREANPKKQSDTGRERKPAPPKPEDHHLRIDFGGLFSNLEDKEWRMLAPNPRKSSKRADSGKLACTPGDLAMVVLPDHQTLAHAMQDEELRAKLYPPDKPAVCLLSREMLFSM